MLIPLQGESILRRAARQAIRARLSPVVVVLGHEVAKARVELESLPCQIAINPDYSGPTSASLHKGLMCLGPEIDAAVVILADMIFVSDLMLRTLVTRCRETAALVVASRYDAVTAPPLLFRKRLFPELMTWNGEGCGRALVERHRSEAVFAEWPIGLLTDVDTTADLQKAQALLRDQP